MLYGLGGPLERSCSWPPHFSAPNPALSYAFHPPPGPRSCAAPGNSRNINGPVAPQILRQNAPPVTGATGRSARLSPDFPTDGARWTVPPCSITSLPRAMRPVVTASSECSPAPRASIAPALSLIAGAFLPEVTHIPPAAFARSRQNQSTTGSPT